ncbi:Hypothetical protein FKW44_024697, partial [Caligus rogercresseyi]
SLINPLTKFIRGYSKEDVTTALILRSICTRAFEYLRSRKLLPLPSRQTQENSNDCSNEGLSYIAGYSGSLKNSTHIW